MSEIKIANRYAQALIQQAQGDKKLETVAGDMQVLFNTCNASKDLRNVLTNPIIASNEKLTALKTIFKNFDNLSVQLLVLVCSKNRENILPEIADAFLAAYRSVKGIQKVTVESAATLDNNTLESIKQFVKNNTGASDIELHASLNPSVIGGLVIKYGDNLLDSSIAAKIRTLKKELNIA